MSRQRSDDVARWSGERLTLGEAKRPIQRLENRRLQRQRRDSWRPREYQHGLPSLSPFCGLGQRGGLEWRVATCGETVQERANPERRVSNLKTASLCHHRRGAAVSEVGMVEKGIGHLPLRLTVGAQQGVLQQLVRSGLQSRIRLYF